MALREARFGPEELELVQEIQPLVEELVGDHFQLTSFGPVRRCYEVVTLASAGPEGRDPSCLAKLCRYDRKERPIAEGARVLHFYRVHLQDDRLLKRSSLGMSLRALLLYVLTHELIHVVRFESFQVHYGTTGVAREEEEKIVHRLTKNVLHQLRDEQVEAVIRGLDPAGVDVVEPQR